MCASVVEGERGKMKINIRNSKIKKRRVSGFRQRNSTKGGRKVLNRRRSRGRTATVFG
jgi:large subunit ribosomal protein L34